MNRLPPPDRNGVDAPPTRSRDFPSPATKGGESKHSCQPAPEAVRDWRALSEADAASYLAAVRWQDGQCCPYCGHGRFFHRSDPKKFACAKCGNVFSVRVGTLFQDSRLQLRKWIGVIWMITEPSVAATTVNVAATIGMRQTSAWSALRILRYATHTRSFRRPLPGGAVLPAHFELPQLDPRPSHKRYERGYHPKLQLQLGVEEAIARFLRVSRREVISKIKERSAAEGHRASRLAARPK